MTRKRGGANKADEQRMRYGAIAMIDALGFKGIWGRNPAKPELGALRTLRTVEQTAAEAVQELSKLAEETTKLVGFKTIAKDPAVEVRFLSDSIVVAASVEQRKRKPRASHDKVDSTKTGMKLAERMDALVGLFRSIVCEIASRLLQTAATAEKPLAYRGVVNTGLFIMHQNFLLGPAVDDAAALMELADASIVWLTPSAILRDSKPIARRGAECLCSTRFRSGMGERSVRERFAPGPARQRSKTRRPCARGSCSRCAPVRLTSS